MRNGAKKSASRRPNRRLFEESRMVGECRLPAWRASKLSYEATERAGRATYSAGTLSPFPKSAPRHAYQARVVRISGRVAWARARRAAYRLRVRPNLSCRRYELATCSGPWRARATAVRILRACRCCTPPSTRARGPEVFISEQAGLESASLVLADCRCAGFCRLWPALPLRQRPLWRRRPFGGFN